MVDKQTEKHNRDLMLSSRGFQYQEPAKKNAFLHPSDPSAEFPQFVPRKIIDFRSSHNPFSGFEMPGNLRKKNKTIVVEETDEAPAQKTAEQQRVEAAVINDLLNLKLEPDRKRAIEKKVDQHRSRPKKGKASKRQLKF